MKRVQAQIALADPAAAGLPDRDLSEAAPAAGGGACQRLDGQRPLDQRHARRGDLRDQAGFRSSRATSSTPPWISGSIPTIPRGLPIFATVRDPGRDGVPGPLDGARLMGQVSYSQSNAVVTFHTLVARGRTVQIQAMAVSESDARAGIAKDVDNHTFERYAALFGASLLQGAGEVGQLLVDQSRNFDYYPDLGAYRSRGTDINRTAAGMGVLRPVGDELTSATKSGFNQPPTITSPSGMGIGVIFTQPLVL